MVFWGSTVPWYILYHGIVLPQNTMVKITMVFWGSTIQWYKIYHGTVLPQNTTVIFKMVFWGSTVPLYSMYHGKVLPQNTMVQIYHGTYWQYHHKLPWYFGAVLYHGTVCTMVEYCPKLPW